MRGQRLFVRPIDPADHDAVRAFLGYVPPCGLLGKLVGNLVAVLAMEITDEGLRQLYGLGNLRELSLDASYAGRGTKVTEAGAAALQAALPGCVIDWGRATRR